MMKTKLGITVGLFGAAIYLMTHFGGYIPLILLGGYVLLFEPNEWLRRTAVKAAVLKVMFSLLYLAVSFLPTVLSMCSSMLRVFDSEFNYYAVSNLFDALRGGVEIFELILFVILGIKALNQGTIVIGFVERIINKFMPRDEARYDAPHYGAN